MPESAVSKMPCAHNHRDAPPDTAVKYENGELEKIERLVDIGHYEVQVITDNCAATLISVDQIVEVGHTVTFSKTPTIITDEEGRYSPRTRIARMDNAYESHGGYNHTPTELPIVSHGRLTIREEAPEQYTRPPRIFFSQVRSGRLHERPTTRKCKSPQHPCSIQT